MSLPEFRVRTIRKFPGRHNRGALNETFGFCSWRIGTCFAASTPARADFSVMRFELGFCRIWWNNGINLVGTGWTRVATAADFTSAWAAQDAAVKKGKCK
jgi:hypothetical protein